MNLFKKIFGSKEKEAIPQEATYTPDNTRLLALIQTYNQEESNGSYANVLKELYADQAFLIVPTLGKKNNSESEGWKTLKAGETIDFTSVFNVDGLLVFGVFTSEVALSKWISEETSFLAMPAKKVLEIAEEQNFGRIVIDSHQETMFILERDVRNQKRETLTEDTEILVWMPNDPISGGNKQQFQEAFSKVDSITEVYHFGITKHNEEVFILAIVLNPKTENAILASQGAINDGMKGFELVRPLEVMYLEAGDDLLETAKQYELFYKK
jgi:hypothetical protein